VAPALAAEGVALFAISYDAVPILAAFGAEHGIGYPLLSDQGSHVMRRLGLLNPRVQEDHAHYGIAPNPRHADLPYPGVFVLDRDGTIVERRFHESYRERDTGAGLVARTLGLLVPGGAAAAAPGDVVSVRASLDSPSYAFFQQLALMVELRVAPGHHVYAAPVPPGYTALAVDVAPVAGLVVGEARWPDPRPLAVGGERFLVHEGEVRTAVPLTFGAAPGGGDQRVAVTVRYQACSDTACLPPASLRVELPIEEAPLVGRTLPARPASA
jgi:hypothetical protein